MYMDKKVIDFAFGEIASAAVLKLHAFQQSFAEDALSIQPFVSGDSGEFGNFVLLNHKDVAQKIVCGMQSDLKPEAQAKQSIERQFPNQSTVKVYDQSFFDPKNPFNFLRRSSVNSSAQHVQAITYFTRSESVE